MKSSQPGQPKPKGPNEATKRNKKCFFGQGKHRKPTVHDEESPLLESSAGLDIDANEIEASENMTASWRQRAKSNLQDVLVWIFENLVIVILACLLAMGTVAVCAYGGKVHRIHAVLPTLIPPSTAPSWTYPKAFSNLHDPWLCSCCI